MSTKIELLLQQLNWLETQDGNFLNWYIKSLLSGHRFARIGNDKTYLPYTGNDEKTILRLFQGYISQGYPDFTIDETNISVINYLVRLTTGKSEKKGLILRGEVGTGKSALVRLWVDFLQKFLPSPYHNPNEKNDPLYYEKLNKIVLIDPTDLMAKFTAKGYSFFSENFGDILIVDDLGVSTSTNYYGSKVNVMEELIYTIYNRSKTDTLFQLFGTTNLTTTQLSELIGERAMSRLSEMTAWKEGLITGIDRRKEKSILKEWPKIT